MADWVNSNVAEIVKRRDLTSSYNGIVSINALNIRRMTDNFDNIFDFLNNITSEISSLQLYPFEIPSEYSGYLVSSKLSSADISVSKPLLSRTYFTLGQYYVSRYYNNFADYKGYTQIKAYIPYLGYVDIDPNECIGKYLQFRLFVDYFTGKGIYIIGVSQNSISTDPPYADLDNDSNMRILSVFETDISIEIPLGASNIGDIKRNIVLGSLKIAASTTFGVAAVAAPSSTTIVNQKSYDVKGRSASKGSKMKTVKSGTETTTKTTSYEPAGSYAHPISNAVESSIDVLNHGTAGGNSDRVNDGGLMIVTSPKVQLVFYRPKFVEDDEYASLYGIPLGKTVPLSTVYGYTEINKVHVEGAVFDTATEAEKEEIHNLLLNGVIL